MAVLAWVLSPARDKGERKPAGFCRFTVSRAAFEDVKKKKTP